MSPPCGPRYDGAIPVGAATQLTEQDRRLGRCQKAIEQAHGLIKEIVTCSAPTLDQLDQLADTLRTAYIEACGAAADAPRR